MRRGLGLARQSKKRIALGSTYARVVDRVFLRARGRCEVVLDGARCPNRARDPHHVVKRSAGGEDTYDNLMAVCRPCHDRTDAAYDRGRLVVTVLGAGLFTSVLVYAPSKFAARDRRRSAQPHDSRDRVD